MIPHVIGPKSGQIWPLFVFEERIKSIRSDFLTRIAKFDRLKVTSMNAFGYYSRIESGKRFYE